VPEPGHFDPRGGEEAQRRVQQQRYPGYGGPTPRSSTPGGEIPPPTNATAALVQAAIKDPGARIMMELLLEETFRNFFSHTILPPWERPPWMAVSGSGKIIDKCSALTDVVATANDWSAPIDLITGDVPQGHIAYLRWRGQGVTENAAWDYTYWRIIERQFQSTGAAALGTLHAIEPYQEWQHQMGQVETPDEIWCVIHGPRTWALQVRGFHVAGPTYHVMGRIKGWLVPMRAYADKSVAGALID